VIGVIGCDDALGALMANMAAAGVLDDTLIIITMDHGW
jgi:arylsulfatase A-like enzyme